MDLTEIVTNISVNGVMGVLVVLGTLIEVTPFIKINPWSSLVKWIGKHLNADLTKELESLKTQVTTNKTSQETSLQSVITKIDGIEEKLDSRIDGIEDTLEQRMDTIEGKLDSHVAESMRRDILDFQNACINGRKHTKEEFTYIYKLCDKYENYVKENDLTNSEAEEAINYIRLVYRTQLQNGAFIMPGTLLKVNESQEESK